MCSVLMFFLPNGSGSGNVSGIHLVLMNQVSYKVMVGTTTGGGYSRTAEQNIHDIHKSVDKL